MATTDAAARAREAITAAWIAWLDTDDHRHFCIGHNEGQWCCAELDPEERDPENFGYKGRMATLLDIAFDAIDRARLVVVPDPVGHHAEPGENTPGVCRICGHKINVAVTHVWPLALDDGQESAGSE